MSGIGILIVDDAPDIRAIVEEIVTRHDHDWQVIATASNGATGVDQARDHQPDLVLLDLSMPVMDGMEALPHLRQAAPGAIIVILTGFPSRAARDQALAAGADDFIDKDDLVHQLVPHLEAILAAVHRSAPRPSDTSPAAEPTRRAATPTNSPSTSA